MSGATQPAFSRPYGLSGRGAVAMCLARRDTRAPMTCAFAATSAQFLPGWTGYDAAIRTERPMPAKLHLDHVGMAFATPSGPFHALDAIDLRIETGRFVSLVGPSGCGKSTVFNIIAGLLQPTE